MGQVPEPLSPPNCDLRGYAFMPLDVVRLLDSDLFALSTGDEFKAAVALWCKAWQQIPAGSLPLDDKILAHLSGSGSKWRKVKGVALRGWVTCSDGRLYHPTVAAKAIEALPKRQEYNEKKTSAAERKQRERAERKELFALLKSHGVTPEFDTPTRKLREMASQFVTDQSRDNVTDVTAGHKPVTQNVTAKRETGEGEDIPPISSVTGDRDLPDKLPTVVRAVMEAAGFVSPPPDLALIDKWKSAGADLDRDIVPTIRAVAKSVRERTGRAPFKLQLFDQPIREKLAADQREIERLHGVAARYADKPAPDPEAIRQRMAAVAENAKASTGTDG